MSFNRFHGAIAIAGLAALTSLAAVSAAEPLWAIGSEDHSDREFALAPSGYTNYQKDSFYVVGRSNAASEWAYVLPGPDDAWGGSRPHEATIAFALTTPPTGVCYLRLALVDAQSVQPPRLQIGVNGTSFVRRPLAGPGDASILGNPSAGRSQVMELAIPANVFKVGYNEVTIGTASGSWIVWDALSLDAPGATLGEVQATRVSGADSPPVLIQRFGRLNQIVNVSVLHAGPPRDVSVTVGSDTVRTHLQEGRQTVEVLVAPVTAVRSTRVSVSNEAGAQIYATNIRLKPVRKMEVYLLPHSHVDIGYTALQSDVLKKQFTNLETAIELARKTANYPAPARFRWSAEVLWAVDAYLKQAPPAKRAELIKAIRAGWIELDALYGNELTALCRPEELLRLVEPAARIARETGVPIRSAMITDVPGYTWGLVPALQKAGVKYFSIGPNPGDRIGSTLSAWGDKPFRWVTPSGDGSVLCWMAGTGYAWFHGRTLAQKGDEELLTYLKQLQDRSYPYDMVQVRYTTNGDNGAPDPTLSDTVRAWNQRYAYPKLVIATTTQMFQAFESRYGAQVPKVSGDFTPYWEDGAASSALETSLNRASAERLVQGEALWAMRNPAGHPSSGFDAAWRNVVLYDEHTWGSYNSISEPDSPFTKGQWAVKQAFALDADRESHALADKALASRGKAVPNAIDVYNPASWDRTDLVTVSRQRSAVGDRVLGPDGTVMSSQRLSSGELAFVARNVPAFGSRRYRIVRGRAVGGHAAVSGTTLRASGIAVSVDPATGVITRLQSATGNLARKLNEYLYVPGRDPKTAVTSGRASVTVKERGPLVVSLQIRSTAPGANSLVREVRLVDGLGRVDIANTIDKRAIRTKEGVHFAFGFDVPKGVVHLDTPWAVVRPETGQIKGACRNFYTVQRWVDVSNARTGITMATVDAPLVEIGGITAELPWKDHIAPSQTVLSYVMNNYWHTNYKADQEGPTTFRYSLAPHRGYDAVAAARLGTEVSQPLVAVAASGIERKGSLLRILPSSVLITSLRPTPDGKALIVRLFGASGRKEAVSLRWSTPRKVSYSDLSGRRLRPVKGMVTVPGWGIVTLRAEQRTAH